MAGLHLVIGNKAYSYWSLCPWLFLKQCDIEFSEKRVRLSALASERAVECYGSDYKAPILVDGDYVTRDSMLMMEHVSDKYLDGGGWPQNAKAGAIARSISAETYLNLTNVRNEMPMNYRSQLPSIEFSDDVLREVERAKSLWRQCREQYGAEGDWLFGRFSIADAMYAPVVLRFCFYDIEMADLEKRYLEYVMRQTAIKEWIEAGKQEAVLIDQDET